MSKLTLEDAIHHCLEVAEQKEHDSITTTDDKELDAVMKEGCIQCATDHEQLAEWLTDYKELKNSIGAVKLGNMKEALALIRTLKAELNGWRENPFGIIAEVCGLVSDCRRCQWYDANIANGCLRQVNVVVPATAAVILIIDGVMPMKPKSC